MKKAVGLPIAGLMFALSSASAQPSWTDIMNYSGFTSAASGIYWEFSDQNANGYTKVSQTYLATYPNMGVPRDGYGNTVSSGGYDPDCTTQPSYATISPPYMRSPQQAMASYAATGIKGVGFLGTFGAGTMGAFGSGSYLFEAIYFHEQACYYGGREYGFFYDAYDGNVYAYWEVNANCASSYCTGGTDSNSSSTSSGADYQQVVSLGSSYTNANYYFLIYPAGDSSSCSFRVSITDPSGSILYSQLLPVDSTINSIDPDFCSNVTSSAGQSGYVTAGTVYGPTVSGIDTANQLSVSRVLAGK